MAIGAVHLFFVHARVPRVRCTDHRNIPRMAHAYALNMPPQSPLSVFEHLYAELPEALLPQSEEMLRYAARDVTDG